MEFYDAMDVGGSLVFEAISVLSASLLVPLTSRGRTPLFMGHAPNRALSLSLPCPCVDVVERKM